MSGLLGTGERHVAVTGLFVFDWRSPPFFRSRRGHERLDLRLVLFRTGRGSSRVGAAPEVMHLRGGVSPAGTWLDFMSRFLIAEASSISPGTGTVLSRLTDILFIQVLRAWLAEQSDEARTRAERVYLEFLAPGVLEREYVLVLGTRR